MKKTLKIAILGVVSLVILYFGVKTYQKLDVKKKLEAPLKTFQDFCLFDLKTMNELCTDSLSEKPILLLFTHPECEFCHEKIKQLIVRLRSLTNQKTQLEDVVILLITHAENEQAFEFYSHYDLSQYDNIHFLIDDYLKVANLYGTPPIPSVFLYCADKKLLFKHHGAVKFETILKHLPT
ncbi:MAG: thioredoxin family protein [Bacteroidales bacterium]|jgi:thioredoxin-related protein|nr:thioredoxin family protein [Bacteroidales bacterium]